MKIHQLKLLNFRNYDKLDLKFSSNCNIIYGKNGGGKTNLVESIYVLALTKSFRGTVDKILIMNNQDVTRIDGYIESNDLTTKYRIILKDNGKKVKINETNVDKLSDYISKISVVLFNPDDLRFIKDSPSVRRKSINVDISQLNNSYLKNLSSYNKLLKQRNSYLKTTNINANASNTYLEVLTNKLIDVGERIYNMRNKFLNMLNDLIGDYYNKICNISDLRLEYVSDYKDFDKDKIQKIYKDNLNKDIILGKTTFGVHHDDIKFLLKNESLKDFGSQGQIKNAMIAYKLALIDLFKNIKKEYPILILDDLFSELDNEKINNILNLISNDIQTFITTTDIDKIDKKVINNSKLFEVVKGRVREEE